MRLPIQLMPFYGYLQLLRSNPWRVNAILSCSCASLIRVSLWQTWWVQRRKNMVNLGTPWVPGPLLWTKLRTHQQPINLRFVGSLLGWLSFDDPLDLKNAATIVGPCWAFSKISFCFGQQYHAISMQYPFPLNNLNNLNISIGKTQSFFN